MPGGGWRDCCCTVVDYDFCDLCLNGEIDDLWLHRHFLSEYLPPRNEVQRVTLPAGASGGTFTLSYGVDTTDPLDWDATAAEVQAALEALPGIGAGNVRVTLHATSPRAWDVEFAGALAQTDVDLLTADGSLLTGCAGTCDIATATTTQGHGLVGEIQDICTGDYWGEDHWTITYPYDGTTVDIPFWPMPPTTPAEAVQAALEGLFGGGNVTATQLQSGTPGVDWCGTGQAFRITFTGALVGVDMHTLMVNCFGNPGPMVNVVQEGGPAENEVQTVTLPACTGGTFALVYDGQTTGPLDYDATAAEVQAALEALSNIGAGNVSVTGSAGHYTIEFIGALAGTNVAQIAAADNLLTGCCTVVVAVVQEAQQEWLGIQGEWACYWTGEGGCPTMLRESTGTGRLISRVPLTKHHSVTIQARALRVGDTLDLYFNWVDEDDYDVLSYHADDATHGTATFRRVEAGVPTVLKTCTKAMLPPYHAGTMSVCFRSGIAVGVTCLGILQAETEARGQLAGFGHTLGSAGTQDYTYYRAYELDKPTSSDLYCGACVHCACKDKVISMPQKWSATLLLNGQKHASDGGSFSCGDSIFNDCWDGTTFAVKMADDDCADGAAARGYWMGSLPDKVGLWTPEGSRKRLMGYVLECPSDSSTSGFPWDYAGPWKFYANWNYSDGILITDNPFHCCFCDYRTTRFNPGHFVDFVVNRELSTCSPLVLVFDAIVPFVQGWDNFEADPDAYPCCFGDAACDYGCPDTVRGYYRRYYMATNTLDQRIRFILTSATE